MTEYPSRDQLRALANAATPGPWEYEWDEDEGEITVRAGTARVGEDGFAPGSYVTTDMILEHEDAWPEDSGEQHAADAEFIAAARTAVPHLLDQLDQAEAELDSWMTRAYEAEGKLWQAEQRLAGWMEHWNATARTGAVDEVAAVLDANARADQSEARVRHLEDTARVLVKEVIAAEDARDEHRRGKAEAEARIKAVQDVLSKHESILGDDLGVPVERIRRALEGGEHDDNRE